MGVWFSAKISLIQLTCLPSFSVLFVYNVNLFAPLPPHFRGGPKSSSTCFACLPSGCPCFLIPPLDFCHHGGRPLFHQNLLFWTQPNACAIHCIFSHVLVFALFELWFAKHVHAVTHTVDWRHPYAFERIRTSVVLVTSLYDIHVKTVRFCLCYQ